MLVSTGKMKEKKTVNKCQTTKKYVKYNLIG